MIFLDLSYNQLSGNIPKEIGNMLSLFILNLGHNNISGNIPQELGNLRALNILDLSYNGLTGIIPLSITNLLLLTEIDMSNNNLSGLIPETGQFETFQASSFSNNTGLCGIHLPPCGSDSQHQKSLGRRAARASRAGSVGYVMIILPLIIVALLSIGVVFMLIFCRRRKPRFDTSAYDEPPSVLLRKVMQVTNNLNDATIVGQGAHGIVYKASVDEGKVFAVKKIAFRGHKSARKSIIREIQTLGNIKHRNLAKLEDFWVQKDYGLLIYKYMQHGSLYDLLHSRNSCSTLNWVQRCKIALGTAHALEYLHFYCDPPIVHCDIKPQNILLDSDLEAHVSDFGIAKLLDRASTTADSSAFAGTFGYIAPEHAFTPKKSKESDVYSYGVVLLELVTGKKPIVSTSDEVMHIAVWVRSVFRNIEDVHHIVDSNLVEEESSLDVRTMDQVRGVILLGLRCTEKEPCKRPTMRDVVNELVNFKWRNC